MLVFSTYRDGLFLLCFLRYSQMGFPCLTGRQNWTHLVIMTLVNEPWPMMYRRYRKQQWYHFECSHWVNTQLKTGLLLLISMENQMLQSSFCILLLWSYTSWADLHDNDVIKKCLPKMKFPASFIFLHGVGTFSFFLHLLHSAFQLFFFFYNVI